MMEKATDVVLRLGGNNEEIRMELAFDAMIDKPIDEIAAHMRTLYHGGSGFELEGRRFSAWYADNGIYIAGGDRARYANTARIVSWKDAAKRVGERINAGRFGTELENVEAAGFVRRQVASRLIEMYRESFAGENGYLPLIREQEPMIFPDCVNRLFEKMEQPDNLHELIRQVEAFAEAVERQPDLIRMRFFMPDAILPRLRDLTHERRELPKGERELPEVRGFITQDEIDWNLTGGSGYESGAERIELFFSQPHDVGEKIEFLKREYGTGGRMPGVSNARHSEEWHDTKGIQLRKNGCQNVTLGWNKVAERIDTLIRNGRYTRLEEQKPEEEIRLVPDMEAYRNLKAERPQYMVGVRVDDYLLFYGEDAKTAAPLLNTKLLERDIPGVGMMPVTGIPFGRWSVAAKTLTENGQSIFFAEPAEQGGYEVVKELNGRRDTPHYQVGDTVYLDDKAFLIEQITDIHVQLRDPTLRYPVIRTERREIFEQMLAENMRNDELFYRQREAMPAEPENFVLTEELPNTPEPQQPQEETKLHSVVVDLTGQETRQRENEQLKAQNFRITDEHLGEGSAKTKFGYNIAAIQTLKQIEAEGRQARPDEQEILSRYVGWGGIPQAFDEENTQWSEEYRQLKELLTEKEYDAARSSTLNAHYTSPTVIRAMYDAIEKMGFRTGNVLEPSCGVGNFFGMLPDDMSGSRLYGVELDSITGRIARQLYPDARITISGFEKTQRRDFFDLAIGNVPFGGYKVSDKQFDKYNFLIHDYFFAKTLEQVRPGGVIAYITSKGTMDKASPDVRRYIAQRAELLGAIRLPNTAFAANAGTSVTTDILFLQKRESPIDIEPDWVHLGQTEEGTGYRARTRFAKFYNLPELMNMFREVADIKTADQLHLPTPNAHYETVVVQPSEIQKRMVQELSKRAAKIHGGAVDPHIDNMLKVSMDGKKLGLDQRLINPMLPDDPGSKVNACVGNVMRIYREGSEQKLTQLIFSDMSTPKNGQEKEFSVYDDIREKLLAQGVPEGEIAFIHNADTEAKKKELFAKVRTGQVRILLGSTAKMGAGTNVQDRLIASHDLDCPWRPGDLEQRAGRIVRQGNRNADVYVYRYVTDGTFDAYSWQTIENKQKFISQVMTSKSPVRVCDDVDESVLSYAEIKALCAGDARIREKMDLDVEVSRLKLMQADYQSKKYRLEDRLLRYFPQEIQNKTERIEGHVQDIACLQAHVLPEDGFQMEVGGKMYTEKEAAGQALIECCKKWKGDAIQDAVTYRGMSASLAFDAGSRTYWLNMHGNMTYSVELGNDPRGNITRIDNRLARVPDNLEKARMELQGLKQQEKAAKEELEKPFAQEAELAEKRMRLAQLNSELNIDDKAPIEAAIEDAQDVPSIREQLRVSSEREMEKRNRNQEREER